MPSLIVTCSVGATPRPFPARRGEGIYIYIYIYIYGREGIYMWGRGVYIYIYIYIYIDYTTQPILILINIAWASEWMVTPFSSELLIPPPLRERVAGNSPEHEKVASYLVTALIASYSHSALKATPFLSNLILTARSKRHHFFVFSLYFWTISLFRILLPKTFKRL